MIRISILLIALMISTQAFAKKNILFIMADDMNDWIGPLKGNPDVKTPNLDKFAKKAMVFKNAYCSYPVCLGSRLSMLTGMRPSTSGIISNSYGPFRNNPKYANIVTLPQHFQKNGFVSMKAGKIFHDDAGAPDPASWDASFDLLGTAFPTPANRIKTGMNFSGYHGDPDWGMQWGNSADETVEQTGDGKGAAYIISKLNGPFSKPFFLAYGASKPHLPWYIPKKYRDLYNPDTLKMPDVLDNDLDDVPIPSKSSHDQSEFIRTGNWKNGVHAYLAALSFADACIGKVLDALEASPYKDSTIVLIMGDHGFHLGEKEHWSKATLWEEATKTTLMIYDPSIKVAGVSNHVVSLQDLYPTLADLANTTASLPAQVEGRSFKSILLNPNTTHFTGWALTTGGSGSDHNLRTNKWALIRYGAGPSHQYELYNMEIDPMQFKNLASANPDIVTKLSADIDHIISGKNPQNTSIYGDYYPTLIQNRMPGGIQLVSNQIYNLRIYNLKGKWIKTIYGKGPFINDILQRHKSMELPSGKYLYSVYHFDKVTPVSGNLSI